MDILRSLLDANPNIYLVGLVLKVAIVVKSFVGQSGKGARDNYSLNNYTLVPSVMTKAEMTFYLSLISTVGDKYTVMVKVRLADIITVKKSSTNYMAHFGKIKAKHVDYLLCDKTDLKPLLAIELDDKSHQREDRIARDKLVDGIFKAVGLPVIHHPVKNTYSQSNLIMIISEAIYNRH